MENPSWVPDIQLLVLKAENIFSLHNFTEAPLTKPTLSIMQNKYINLI